MARTIAGTLNVPDTGPLANAEIYFVAKRNEATKILQGVSSVITTDSSGNYSQSIEDGYYAVSLRYDDGSGNQLHRYALGNVFVETGSEITLNALLAVNDSVADPTDAALQQLLADAQTARDEAVAAAAEAEQDAANADFRNYGIGSAGPAQSDANTMLMGGIYAGAGGAAINFPGASNYHPYLATRRSGNSNIQNNLHFQSGPNKSDCRSWLRSTNDAGVNWQVVEFFTTGNLLGSVSQSGGVPTGAIIERGSNANGEYLKFADGSLFMAVTVDPDWTSTSVQIFSFPVSTVGGSSSSFGGVAGANSGSAGVTPRFESIRFHGCTNSAWLLLLDGSASNGSGSENQLKFFVFSRWY